LKSNSHSKRQSGQFEKPNMIVDRFENFIIEEEGESPCQRRQNIEVLEEFNYDLGQLKSLNKRHASRTEVNT